MILIQHRVNTISQLMKINDISLGCEIDLRSDLTQKDHLVVTHDPWTNGESFADWLAAYKQKGLNGPLILNTKEDGLEKSILQQLQEAEIENYFFLDTCLPTLVKLSQNGLKNIAVRYSNFEPLESVLKFQGLAEWVWVDCFANQYPTFHPALKNFKICLVSPELQGFELASNTQRDQWLPQADAICTKDPEHWKKLCPM